MRSAKRLHYAWIVAAVTFVVGLLTAGVRAAPGVLIVPLEQEFHWSRATISFAIGINLLLYGAGRPVRRGADGPLWRAPHDDPGAGGDRGGGGAVARRCTQAWQLVLLWGVVVGARHRRHRRLSRGLYRGALVPPPPGAGGRHADRRQRRRSAGVSADLAALVTHAGWRVMSLVLAGTSSLFVPLRGAADARPAAAISGWRPMATSAVRAPRSRRRAIRSTVAFRALARRRAQARFLADRRRLFCLRRHRPTG